MMTAKKTRRAARRKVRLARRGAEVAGRREAREAMKHAARHEARAAEVLRENGVDAYAVALGAIAQCATCQRAAEVRDAAPGV